MNIIFLRSLRRCYHKSKEKEDKNILFSCRELIEIYNIYISILFTFPYFNFFLPSLSVKKYKKIYIKIEINR